MLSELSEVEARHMETLKRWGILQTELEAELPIYAIERAAKYYDALFSKQDGEARIQSLSSEFRRVCVAVDEAEAELTRCGSRLRKLSQEGAHEPGAAKNVADEAEMLRKTMERLAAATDAHVKRKNQIEEELAMGLEYVTNLQKRFEELAAPHAFCSWRCSVARTKSYYDHKLTHQRMVDVEMRQIESLQKRLKAV